MPPPLLPSKFPSSPSVLGTDMEPYEIVTLDAQNINPTPESHTLIRVREVKYLVYIGTEQATANEIAFNLDG